MPGDPFDLDLPQHMPLRRAAASAVRPLLRRALGLDALRDLYDNARTRRATAEAPITFAAAALAALEVAAECVNEQIDRIPDRGPLIIAANHPHGALDGLVLLDAVGRKRQDVRLLANYLLARIPELHEVCFFVDPFDSRDSPRRSLGGLRAAHAWLRAGGALIVFPAGDVAHARAADGAVVDSRWRSTVGRLAIAADAAVVPAHIDGGNSALFYFAGRLHPRLRTVLLGRELLKQRQSSLVLQLGQPMPPAQLAGDGRDAHAVSTRIRTAVDGLGIAPSLAPYRLAADIAALPPDARLLSAGDFDVYCARAAQIPDVLEEIGRLRERSFRAVGEGTGKASDLDRFDEHYEHLFVWNRRAHDIVGAYRIGRTDLLVGTKGVGALYTRTLFDFDERLLNRLPPALELGRSFVRPEYQRDHGPLLLLWKGICAFVQQHRQYRVLFGAVSISSRYGDRTRALLMRFLEQNHLHQELADLVSSRRPHFPAAVSGPAPERVEMPVLLRQYLKLNARALGFNVDPAFGDVLDALMMVDLLQVDPRILRRYFGAAGARRFLEHHLSPSRAA